MQLGRTSLFIYWIHVELVYGLISLPLHRALSLPAAAGRVRRVLRLDARVFDGEGRGGRALPGASGRCARDG